MKIHDRDSAIAALHSKLVLRDAPADPSNSPAATASGSSAPPDLSVASIQPLDARGTRVRVACGDGSALEIALEIWAAGRFGVGDTLPIADRERLLSADARWQARQAALDLLARRPYGRSELRRRLIKKGFTSAAVDECLVALAKEKLVDDDQFARLFVSDRLRLRPRGRRRLSQELREKGVEGATAESAVDAVFTERGVDEQVLASEAALGWLKRQGTRGRKALAEAPRSPDRQKAERRLGGFLARRGFGGSVAREAIRVAVEAARANGEKDAGPSGS